MQQIQTHGVKEVPLPRGVNVVSAVQARAARSVLGLSVGKLSGHTGISASSIRRIEDGQAGSIKLDLVLQLQRYFEDEGLTFVWQDEQHGLLWPVSLANTLASRNLQR